ncbi:hypothetical protein [Oceanomicrobium pacificus]|uniref:PH domain-containing protein n=1 Tax=Oceanomicrobium pacificus TaxID=2692916 RepID=A0A6B0TPK0_9RHOB|nr:hypothetical protein [Oceanomicrobium pacificus]MXU66580.1 hypothetical protein [Oceanomicrobium pacificus]
MEPQTTTTAPKVFARLDVSQNRRYFGVAMLGGLGLLLLYIAAAHPPQELLGLVTLILFGAGALWQGWRLWRATAQGILLTSEGLHLTDGTEICRLDQIRDVDRGFFSFKPSNGFLLRLKEPMPRVWAPGLWWRFHTRAGIGGTTSARQGKEMADAITILLSERGADLLMGGADTPPDS